MPRKFARPTSQTLGTIPLLFRKLDASYRG